jgi:hypothetical protein
MMQDITRRNKLESTLPWKPHTVLIKQALKHLGLNECQSYCSVCEISSSHGGEYEVQICLLG